MQWRILGNILLFTITNAFSQTYIVKVSSNSTDTTYVNRLIRQSVGKGMLKSTQPASLEIQSLSSQQSSSATQFPWHQYFIVRSDIELSQNSLRAIESDPSIEYIQSNRLYTVNAVPNDSAYPSQWNLERIGVSALHANGTIHASLPQVKVGVIDTGIDDDHPDLKNVIAINSGEFGNGKQGNGVDDDNNGFIDDWRGYDFVNMESEDAGDWELRDNDPADEHGHGTAVSGIIGAQTNNSIGIAGIVDAQIIPLRAFGKNGNGNDIDIASAIIYAADLRVHVINMSFGDVVRSSFLHDAIRYAHSKNIVLVASSGNDGSSGPHYPSDFPEVISTGSVNRFNSRSIFSSRSPSLDLMAPGENISTTALGGGYTDQFAGTSAAAPHVAGVSALLISVDEKKKLESPLYYGLSNDEIRGILINSASEAGTTGWDEFYGAGVINVVNAIQSVAGSVVTIHSPSLDEILSGSTIPIVISAMSPYLHSVSLYFGSGENPDQWTQITHVASKFYSRDTIAVWNIQSLPSNTYILRLAIKNSKGSDHEFRQRITIHQSNPTVTAFQYRDSIIVGDSYGTLIEARTDRNTNGMLYFREKGETKYHFVQSIGLQKNHFFILSSKELLPFTEYEYYCQFTEFSGPQRSVRFPTLGQTGTEHFSVKTGALQIPTTGFVQKSFSLPKGFLLNSVQTVNGKLMVIMNEYTQDDFGILKSFEFSTNRFVSKDSLQRSWVPRSFVQSGYNNSPSLLVQEHGVTQVFQVDTAIGLFVRTPFWGDSNDVWGSTFHDLDGDGIREIIARSSSEYVVYKKTGASSFSIVSRLPNPSVPLLGDAKNQFGPPRSIVGDFTGTGRKEIIFADYDGDLLLYRQSVGSSLQFDLIGIDTTELYEMSDYITSGDFNGDGIMDFAVAGHSNLDWNGDREYDAPVWTVRVFSHQSSDPIGKVSLVWQQHFFGVKAGSGYDNGIMTGKLRSTDTRDALFISLNPSLYVFEWNTSTQSFASSWMHRSQSNSVILHDFENDGFTDIGFASNGKTEFWTLPGNSIPASPYGVTAQSLNASTIRLMWSSSASTHRIYRGFHKDSLTLIAAVSSATFFVDSTVINNLRYYYSVTAVGGSESQPSAIVTARPHTALSITSVGQHSSHQLTINLSSEVSSSNLLGMEFLLDSTIRSSGVIWRSSRSVVATFPSVIPSGSHSIRITQLVDVDEMDGDTTNVILFNTTLTPPSNFIVQTVGLLSNKKINIEFSEPVDFSTAKNISNYSVRSVVRTFTVGSIDSVTPRSVTINIPGSDLSTIAVRIEIAVRNTVLSLSGTPLNEGKGQIVSIAQETNSLDQIVVYPNPVQNANKVSFINIPANCKITIYSPGGDRIIMLSERTTSEGLSWNLRSESGNLVSTGIYLYRVEQLNEVQESIKTKVGKFAVIR